MGFEFAAGPFVLGRVIKMTQFGPLSKALFLLDGPARFAAPAYVTFEFAMVSLSLL
jgi:hypothetical protein